jgi:hypothetical protein
MGLHVRLLVLLFVSCGLLAACDRNAPPQRQGSSNEGKAMQSAGSGSAHEGKAAGAAAK